MITFRVLGPLAASSARGPVDLKGPRHRAVLARLLIARGRVVPVSRLVADLWEDPPDGAVGAVQTFVATLRKALEPDRPPRTPARLLVTAAPGYALRAEAVDAWLFETAVTTTGAPGDVLAQVDEALGWWRGPAYAEFADEPWARGEIARLDELRLLALERRASARLDLARPAEAVPDLEALVEDHPWRESTWRLLALARYRAGRQGDALETLRRARQVLATELGLDPGPTLRRLEADILAQAPGLDGPAGELGTGWGAVGAGEPAGSGGEGAAVRSARAGGEVSGGAREGVGRATGRGGDRGPARGSGRKAAEAPGGSGGEHGSAVRAGGGDPAVGSGSEAPDGAGSEGVRGAARQGSGGSAAGKGSAGGIGEASGGSGGERGVRAAGSGGRASDREFGEASGERAPGRAGERSGAAGSGGRTGHGTRVGGLGATSGPTAAGDGDRAREPVGGTSGVDRVRAEPSPLLGRDEELARTVAAADGVLARQRVGLVLVAGEAGAGKTALAEACVSRLGERGWTTAWGGSTDEEGLPSAWPWTRILAALPGAPPEPGTSGVLPGTPWASPGVGTAERPAGPGAFGGPVVPGASGDPAVARFHWRRAVVEHLGGFAPLLLVLEDLHWAEEETLALLAALVVEPLSRAVLVVGTYRTTDVPARLAGFLGRVARVEPVRVYLGGLSVEAVAGLARATAGRDIEPAVARVIHRRSGGNPFFVRELGRLLAAGGDLAAVPAGVRDVVRYRLTTLPDVVQDVLRHAAVLGADVDLDLLPGEGALDALELATARGFLVELGPGRFRFAHALVRDTLYQDLSRSRRVLSHAHIAEVLERVRPHDVAALAHHFLHAEGPAATIARYARAAAEQAERRFAPHHAARLWRAALDHVGDDHLSRLSVIMGLVRALAVTGALAEARRHRAEALRLAEDLADPALTAEVIAAFDVPAVWTENDDPVLAERIVAVTERTLAAVPPGAAAVRSRLLSTIALELRNTGGVRAREAAREAEAIARDLDDPAVLAFALNARFMQSFDRAGRAPERAGIGAELVELGARHALVTFEVLGHLILVQANAALADITAADRHAAAAERLGEDYDIPLVSVLIDWYRAMRTTLSGRSAEVAYRAAAKRLAGSGMSGMSGVPGLALLCERVQRGLPARPEQFGGYEPWCRPLVLLAEGDVAGARDVSVPSAPRDLLFEVRTCLHAVAATALDDRAAMARLYAELEPAADELAGAGSGLLTLRPVAHYLGDLATALGRDAVAAEHYRRADEVAARAGAAHWMPASGRRRPPR